MKKNLPLLIVLLFTNLLQAQPIDYDNLSKEYQDVAIQAFTSIKPSTKKWVEETALKHPPGRFDTTWVKGQVAGLLGGGVPEAGIWAVMIAYQKLMNKEAREGKKINRADAAMELKTKESQLATDNKKIDQQKQEANERYDNAVQAANTQTGKGIASTSKQGTNEKNAADAGADHRRVMQDNVRKLLDQIAEMKRTGRY